MRNTIIIFISAFLAFFGFVVFVNVEEVENHNVGRVLGASEQFEQKIIRSNLSLSDVLSQETTPEPIKTAIEVSKPEKIKDIEISLPVTSAIAVDKKSGEILFEQEPDRTVPIASISKLMTALTFLDFNLDWNQEYQIKSSDFLGGGHQYVAVGDILNNRSLFSLSLVASANTATQALVSATGKSNEEFVELMNKKALAMDLKNTSFRDPVGFSQYNISTAREIAKIIEEAIERNEVREVITLSKYECLTGAGQKRFGYSTNKLFNWEMPENIGILGGKTGYTELAGNCFAGSFYINNEHDIITVVMGASSENERFRESLALVKWVKDSYKW
jgi:D-alanyl-D-alanine endopeptidase (penicillin-binding protein 7)